MLSQEKLREFVIWVQHHLTGDEKGQAQIFLDRLFQALGQLGCLEQVKLVTEDCTRPNLLAAP